MHLRFTFKPLMFRAS